MIKGSRFHLRTIMEKDLDDLVRLLGDISRQGDYLPLQFVSQSHLREAFEKNGFWSEDRKRLLMIGEGDEIIGSIWIFKPVPYFDALELGYALFDEKHRGKGLMTEAVGLVVDYVFKAHRVNRLEIRCDVDNKASARVAEKLGFVHEGIAHQATWSRGEHHDMRQYALLRTNWTDNSDSGDQQSQRRAAQAPSGG